MNKKALLVTTVSGFVPQFEMSNVQILQEMGFEVHYASNFYTPSYGNDNSRLEGTGIITHQIDFVRSPYSGKNIKVYRQLETLMKEEDFALVHCHTPMGAALTRLAAHRTHTAPVIYTAHGFHFYNGAPLKNWIIYYTMEYLLSYYTDQQICINKEDYRRASEKMHAHQVNYIPGVGIDTAAYRNVVLDISAKKEELGICPGKIILLSAGELIHRKNHETVIRALANLEDQKYLYLICGHGELEEYLKKLTAELGVEEQVRFLGYRTDIREIYKIADIFVFPSFQEGLPIALLEAMASGLPVICSHIRGNCDLVTGEEGMLVQASDTGQYVNAIRKMAGDKVLRAEMGMRSQERAIKFDIKEVSHIMRKIYAKNISNHGSI